MDLIDVTLRDGGHAVNSNWDMNFASKYYELMCKIPEVKFIELGYWKQSAKSDKPFYNLNLETVSKIVGKNNHNNVSIMIDYHYCSHNIDDYPNSNQNIISMIRLCVRKEDMENGLEFGRKLKEGTGLNVSLNIFNASNYTPEELNKICEKVYKYPFDYVYFADTHGSMEFPKDFYIFKESVKMLKDSGKKVGMHLHDHSGKAILNYNKLDELGFESSDTSIRGMGKGSGNLKLEFVVNKNNLIDVADFINEYNEVLTIKPTPYELITALYSLTDNYAKEAHLLGIPIKKFNDFCLKINGLDKDTYNKKLLEGMNGNVFITGTSSGLGFALATIFKNNGYNVYGLSRSKTNLDISQKKCDFNNLDSINEILSTLVGDIPFNYVFLNAGMLGVIDNLDKITIDDFKEIYNVNVLSNKLILDYLLINNKPKTVIGISSGAALKTYCGWSLYCTSKSAFKQLISSYSDEFTDTKFVNLAPGIIKTKMQDAIKSVSTERIPSVKKFHDMYENMDTPEMVAKEIIKKLPIIENTISGDYIDMRNL